ncbi:MAG: VOC family protein [Candidatus Rokubacteria bacterium]|nr:VOC family protein [Candidatus Rokubacteria bacterium]
MRHVAFDHIAIAVPRMADAPAFLVGVLGGAPYRGSDSGVYRWAQWRFEGGGLIEILEPQGRDGFLHRFLTARGAGVHHVTFKAADLDAACARARAHGYDVVGRDDSDDDWKEAFLHPRQAQGIVVQMAQPGARGGVPRQAIALPSGPPSPPPPARIVGLVVSARSADRALAQWRDVLGGEVVAQDARAILVRWPESPMRIAVTIDATAAEGPVAVEVTAERPLDLSAQPFFRQVENL